MSIVETVPELVTRLMRERDEALLALIDARSVAGLVRRAADNPRASGKRDGFTRPTEAEWREIVTRARECLKGRPHVP